MPIDGDPPDLLVDTSVAVALVVGDHEQHDSTREALRGKRLGLAGHAAFETFSVLTRLPSRRRPTPGAVQRLLVASFPASRFLGADAAGELLGRLADIGVAGSAVYDALVGATASEHRLPLASRDRRAITTYRALDVEVVILA